MDRAEIFDLAYRAVCKGIDAAREQGINVSYPTHFEVTEAKECPTNKDFSPQ